MKNKQATMLLIAVVALLWVLTASKMSLPGDPIQLQYPTSWPSPAYDFSKNLLTQQGVDLGRKLFYDPIMSRNGTVSCSNCHLSYTAFTHVDHALSHGIEDRIGARNSPALMNLAWSKFFMWDGAVNHLDVQALAPIAHPAEMDDNIANVVAKIQAKQPYPTLFFLAFGDSTVSGEHLLKAIAQFELTLISANSKYDQVQRGEAVFSEQESNGHRLFQQNCASCHTEPLFTNGGFERNGLPIDTILQDFGRMRITQNPVDSLKFKVPTLRNIEFSHPYMHDGRFKTLREVLNHYSNTTVLNRKIELTANEKTDLIAFLLNLSDRSFLFNPAFAYPKE